MKTPYTCPECQNGQIVSVVEDYRLRTSDGNVIVVPEVELHRCNACGETVIPRASGKKIKEFKALRTEQLSKEELHAIFDRANMTQKDFAEVLGLGEKTFHRWLKGTQKVSRSMGYYLRAIDQFPEVFQWIRDRRWRNERETARPQQSGDDDAIIFAALHRRQTTMVVETKRRLSGNPAMMLASQAVHFETAVER